MVSTPLSLSAPAQNLRRLVAVRSLLIVILSAAIGFAYNGSLPLHYTKLIGVLSVICLFNIITWWRLNKFWPVTEVEFFAQLIFDIASITIILYLSGGANNPFVSYYLVPLCVSAATLAWGYTWGIASISLTAYSLLLFYHVPIPDIAPEHHQNDGNLNLHILGMWFNFLVSAILITYFVVKMASTLRQQESQLSTLREDDLRDEQVMAVATLAAGTAHKLGTPLSTMKVLLTDMQKDNIINTALGEDLQILQNQVSQCSNTLRNLTQQAELNKDCASAEESVKSYCQHVLDQWLLMRPEVVANIEMDTDAPNINAVFPPTIAHSIINLLNNAADANPENIVVNINWDRQLLKIDIIDHGSGIPVKLANQLGKPFFTTKGKGLGLGLFLTHATLSRYNGTIKLFNREAGGTLTELRLPLQQVNATKHHRD